MRLYLFKLIAVIYTIISAHPIHAFNIKIDYNEFYDQCSQLNINEVHCINQYKRSIQFLASIRNEFNDILSNSHYQNNGRIEISKNNAHFIVDLPHERLNKLSNELINLTNNLSSYNFQSNNFLSSYNLFQKLTNQLYEANQKTLECVRNFELTEAEYVNFLKNIQRGDSLSAIHHKIDTLFKRYALNFNASETMLNRSLNSGQSYIEKYLNNYGECSSWFPKKHTEIVNKELIQLNSVIEIVQSRNNIFESAFNNQTKNINKCNDVLTESFQALKKNYANSQNIVFRFNADVYNYRHALRSKNIKVTKEDYYAQVKAFQGDYLGVYRTSKGLYTTLYSQAYDCVNEINTGAEIKTSANLKVFEEVIDFYDVICNSNLKENCNSHGYGVMGCYNGKEHLAPNLSLWLVNKFVEINVPPSSVTDSSSIPYSNFSLVTPPGITNFTNQMENFSLTYGVKSLVVLSDKLGPLLNTYLKILHNMTVRSLDNYKLSSKVNITDNHGDLFLEPISGFSPNTYTRIDSFVNEISNSSLGIITLENNDSGSDDLLSLLDESSESDTESFVMPVINDPLSLRFVENDSFDTIPSRLQRLREDKSTNTTFFDGVTQDDVLLNNRDNFITTTNEGESGVVAPPGSAGSTNPTTGDANDNPAADDGNSNLTTGDANDNPTADDGNNSKAITGENSVGNNNKEGTVPSPIEPATNTSLTSRAQQGTGISSNNSGSGSFGGVSNNGNDIPQDRTSLNDKQSLTNINNNFEDNSSNPFNEGTSGDEDSNNNGPTVDLNSIGGAPSIGFSGSDNRAIASAGPGSESDIATGKGKPMAMDATREGGDSGSGGNLASGGSLSNIDSPYGADNTNDKGYRGGMTGGLTMGKGSSAGSVTGTTSFKQRMKSLKTEMGIPNKPLSKMDLEELDLLHESLNHERKFDINKYLSQEELDFLKYYSWRKRHLQGAINRMAGKSNKRFPFPHHKSFTSIFKAVNEAYQNHRPEDSLSFKGSR